MDLVYVYALGSTLALVIVANIVVRVVPATSAHLPTALGYFSALAVGSLLGDAFIYLLPKATAEGWNNLTTVSVLAGVVSMLIAEQMITWDEVNKHRRRSKRNHAAMSNMFGFTAQSFIDGLVIAGAYGLSIPLGLATTIAVIIHQVPQEISNFVILRRAGISNVLANRVGTLAVMISFVGAIVGLLIPAVANGHSLDFLAPFTAGVFMYVSIGQLVPGMMMERSRAKGIIQLLLIFLGLLLIALVKYSKAILGSLD